MVMIGELIGGKYLVKDVLGKGGTAIVYLAKKRASNEYYAIKTIPSTEDDAIKLLEREASVLKRLKHPNIVQFVEHGYDQELNIVYLVLQFIDGIKLKDYMDAGISIQTKLQLFLQILQAVNYAHSEKVIHRDIKPSNIVVLADDDPPKVKVLDFGISKILTTISGKETLRDYYTPLFSSPEQKLLQGVSRESDVYSLGMTFAYLLSVVKDRIGCEENLDKNILFNSIATNINIGQPYKQNLLDILKRSTSDERKERPKIDQIRKVFYEIQESLAEKSRLIFWPSENLQKEISERNGFNDRTAKIIEYIKEKLSGKSDIIYLKKNRFQNDNPDLINVDIGCSSCVFRGFIDKQNPFYIKLNIEMTYAYEHALSILEENGESLKVEPIIVTDFYSLRELSSEGEGLNDLINKILQKEEVITVEKAQKEQIKKVFENWQNIIEVDRERLFEKKERFTFPFSNYNYDRSNQRLIVHLIKPIEEEILEEITHPPIGPLPVTITIRTKASHPLSERQKPIGKIVDGKGDVEQNGVLLITNLSIALSDFFETDLIDSIPDHGIIVIDTHAHNSIIKREKQALKDVRYGDSENRDLAKIITNPKEACIVESVHCSRFFNEDIDDSQQRSVERALGTQDIFLIQGPPGTGKTTVITELVLQILERYPKDKILISSQSNVAVDNVLIKIVETDPNKNLLRIGKDDKIEPDAKRFELEKAVMKWQENIIREAEKNWQKFEEEHFNLLSGVEKKSALGKIIDLNKKRRTICNKLLSAITEFNSDLVLSDNDVSQEDLGEAFDYIDEKINIEEEMMRLIKQYIEKYNLQFPQNTPLVEWSNNQSERLQNILGPNDEKHKDFIARQEIKDYWCKHLKRKQIDLVPIFFEDVNVIGATCLGVANLFKSLKTEDNITFDWVIIDESGRSTPAETFVPMSRGKKIILVGDHKQLPPVVDRELSERAYQKHEIERIVFEESLFEYLYRELPESNRILLSYQYRMHPHIGDLVSRQFYEPEDKISSKRVDVKEKKHGLSFKNEIYWVTTLDGGKENIRHKKVGKSFKNAYEASVIKRLLELIEGDCKKKGVEKSVGVITAYAPQKSVLETQISSMSDNKWTNLKIVIHTVDAFQGKECDIIIYDLVRSHEDRELGFISDYRRLNVALSRAKQLLFIVGNDQMASEGRTPNRNLRNPFKPLIRYIQENTGCEVIPSKTIR